MQHTIKLKSNHGFEWIDLVEPTDEELHAMATSYQLHPAAVQDCLQPEHLPKYELIEDVQFMICRYYDSECPKNADSIRLISRKLAIFWGKDFIITVHRKSFEAFDEVAGRASAIDQPYVLVCKLVKACLQTYEEPLQKLDAEIDFYESRIFLKKRIPDLLKNLYFIKRKTYVIRRISNLSKEIPEKLGVNNKRIPAYQDLKDYYIKLDTVIEEVYDSINSLMNIYISLSSQRTNEVMRTLTVFTAFFLPLTFIVGVYGMNFHYMPELNHPSGYPMVLGLMLFITLFIWIWFKRKGWM
ncbi:MAG: CorA family divalent cation transporter [Bacteroidota bacterium]|jgi:magnesium transporter